MAKGSSGRMLLAVHFALAVEDAEEGDVTTGMGYMVYSRSGGFMMVVPKHASVRSTLDSWSEHGSPLAPGFLETKVTLETSRGRAIGDATVGAGGLLLGGCKLSMASQWHSQGNQSAWLRTSGANWKAKQGLRVCCRRRLDQCRGHGRGHGSRLCHRRGTRTRRTRRTINGERILQWWKLCNNGSWNSSSRFPSISLPEQHLFPKPCRRSLLWG